MHPKIPVKRKNRGLRARFEVNLVVNGKAGPTPWVELAPAELILSSAPRM
jgi:hypothetical protein